MAGNASRENGKKGGRRKGVKNHATIAKEEAREIARTLITAELEPLIASQISNAKGLSFLVVREKATGKFLRVGKNRAERLNPEEEIIEIWEKDPSVQAFTDLLNRALDKAKEQEQDINVRGSIDVVETLRRRSAQRNAATLGAERNK